MKQCDQLINKRQLCNPVWHSWKNFNTFAAATPAAFGAKSIHFPALARSRTAVVVIDVLRATTTLSAVAAAGASGIHVAIKPTDGSNPFESPPPQLGPWVCGGEENGKPITGGVIGNSPRDVTTSLVEGKYVKFVSTNGARAVDQAVNLGFCDIYIACLANIAVTLKAAIANGAERILFAAGGFYQTTTYEDTFCIGIGTAELIKLGFADELTCCDEAVLALRLAENYPHANDFLHALQRRQVPLLLNAIGLGHDVTAVITGDGVDTNIWTRMRRTVVRYERRNGIDLFTPSLNEEQ